MRRSAAPTSPKRCSTGWRCETGNRDRAYAHAAPDSRRHSAAHRLTFFGASACPVGNLEIRRNPGQRPLSGHSWAEGPASLGRHVIGTAAAHHPREAGRLSAWTTRCQPSGSRSNRGELRRGVRLLSDSPSSVCGPARSCLEFCVRNKAARALPTQLPPTPIWCSNHRSAAFAGSRRRTIHTSLTKVLASNSSTAIAQISP